MDMAEKSENTQEAMLAELKRIIYNGETDAILGFLSQYKSGNITVLKETLKKAKSYWVDSKDFPDNLSFNPEHNFSDSYYHRPYLENRVAALSFFVFALLGLSELNPMWYLVYVQIPNIVKNEKFLNILIELKPAWLTEYLKIQMRKSEMRHMRYADLRILEAHGVVDFDPELFALSIAELTVSQQIAVLETIEQYTADPIIYQRDIFTLFDYETRIFDSNYRSKIDDKTYQLWYEVFIRLIEAQKIERGFCIKKILEIQTKDWQNNAKSFFKKIMAFLEPTTSELLRLQDSIFLLLHSEFGATVGFAIQTIKPLIGEPTFNFAEYLTWLAAVMPRGDAKGSIKAILQQMTVALKCYPAFDEAILNVVADAFTQSDIDVQEKAAKLLAKHLKPEHDQVIDKIRMYQGSMIGGVKDVLGAYLGGDAAVASHAADSDSTQQDYVYTELQPQYLNPAHKIEPPQTWQELLFFMGEAVKSNDPLDHDLILSAWLVLRPQFPKDYLKKLKPIIKQMEKWTESRSRNFFNDFFVEFIQTDNVINKAVLRFYLKFLNNYYELLTVFSQLARQGAGLPLLSLPTHAPSFIDPEVLVQRLIQYQAQGIAFDLVDLAIALCRTPPENMEPARALLPQITDKTLQQLLYFFLGTAATPPDFAAADEFKAMPLRQQNDWHGVWDSAIKTRDGILRDARSPDYTLHPRTRLIWSADQATYDVVEAGEYVNFKIPPYSEKSMASIYTALCFDSKNRGVGSDTDLVFFRHMTPVNQVFNDLDLAANACHVESVLEESMTHFLQCLMQESYVLNPYTLFVLAAYGFNKSKDVRLAVSQALSVCFSQQKVDLAVFAQHLSVLVFANYAPFSRLLECLLGIKDSADLNNRALIQLIGLMLISDRKPENLPVKFKGLFELYYELLTRYQVKPDEDVRTHVLVWEQKFPSLKSIIQKILKETA